MDLFERKNELSKEAFFYCQPKHKLWLYLEKNPPNPIHFVRRALEFLPEERYCLCETACGENCTACSCCCVTGPIGCGPFQKRSDHICRKYVRYCAHCLMLDFPFLPWKYSFQENKTLFLTHNYIQIEKPFLSQLDSVLDWNIPFFEEKGEIFEDLFQHKLYKAHFLSQFSSRLNMAQITKEMSLDFCLEFPAIPWDKRVLQQKKKTHPVLEKTFLRNPFSNAFQIKNVSAKHFTARFLKEAILQLKPFFKKKNLVQIIAFLFSYA